MPLTLHLGELRINITCLVVDDLPTPIVLGVPTMEAYGLYPDVAHKRLRSVTHPSLSVPMSTTRTSGPTKSTLGQTVSAITIPAYSEVIAPLQLKANLDKETMARSNATEAA